MRLGRNFLNSMGKLNLIHEIANEASIQNSFEELRAKRKESHHNHDIWHLAHHWDKEKQSIIRELRDGTYLLQAVKKCYIKETDCVVSVWTSRDSVVLNALKKVLEGRIKKASNFSKVTHLKGNGGVKGSINRASKFMQRGSFIFKTDITDYFSNINHKILLSKVKSFTNDKMVQSLIRQYITIAEEKHGEYKLKGESGIPRGNGLSHILSAIYLHDVDKLVKKTGVEYIRYADDILIVSKKRHQLRQIRRLIYRECNKLKLCLSVKKTFSSRVKEGIEFLGYFISTKTLDVAKETVQRMRDKLLQLKEQNASTDRVKEYQSNWMRWAIGGVSLTSTWTNKTNWVHSDFAGKLTYL